MSQKFLLEKQLYFDAIHFHLEAMGIHFPWSHLGEWTLIGELGYYWKI